MDDVVYQENRLYPIILVHIYSWKILKMSDFMFLKGGGTPQFVIYRVEEHVEDMVYQENWLCPIILVHIYCWKILKLSNFMFLKGRGAPQFVILQFGGTCGGYGISGK